jgi:hypothetical protein
MAADSQETPKPRRGVVPALVGVLLLGGAALFAPVNVFGPPGPTSTLPVWVGLWTVSLALGLGGVYMIVRRRSVSLMNLGLAAGVSAACLAASEVTLAVNGVRPLKRIVWKAPALAPWWQLDPAQGGRVLAEKYDGAWTFNAEGFPDTGDFDAAKAAEVPRRILLLGDSFAYGASASSLAKSFAELLDARLDATIETLVWNLAIPGTGQESQFHLLSEYLPILKPQIVVATLYMNDFEDNRYPPDQYYVFSDGNWVQRYTRTHGTTFEALSPAAAYRRAFAPQYPREYLKTLRTASAVADVLHRWGPPRSMGARHSSGSATPGYAETNKWLERIRDAVTSADARLIVLLIPDRADLAIPTQAYRDMQSVCGELGVGCVEVLARLKADDYAALPDGHWTDSGHAKAAVLLQDAIENAWNALGAPAK